MHFSKKFKRAWMRNNQRLHDMLLARPPARYLQRWPDPALERSLPAPVPVAALLAKTSTRTLELAQPKRYPTPPLKKVGEVDPACLKHQPSQRLLELSRPVLKTPSPSSSPRKSPKGKKRTYDKERVLILAQRHPNFEPPKEEKKAAKRLSELLPRIKILCELPKRYQSPDLPSVPVVSKLKLEKKEYVCSDRVKQLANPREFAEFKLDEDFDPYLINPAALTYTPTDNIKKLAEPRHKEEKRIKKG